MSQEICANCGKPYGQHLSWKGLLCSAKGTSRWFPKGIADAVKESRRKAIVKEETKP